MVRVLYVIATLDPAGAERQLVALATRLDRSAFEPTVCCLTRGGPLEQDLAAADVPVHVLHKRGKLDLGALLRLCALVRRSRPHVVHTWLFTANLWGRLAAILCGVPVIVASERAADVWKTPLHRWVDRRLAARSACVLANARAVERFCVQRVGLAQDRVRVILNGFDIDAFDAAAAILPAGDVPDTGPDPVIGVVARMEEQKGLAYLVRAMGYLQRAGCRAQLWMVGDGPLRPDLQRLADDEGVRHCVRFLGQRPDIPALMQHMDLVVLPSLWEGLPNVLIEAMGASRPVVATDVDGTPEVVVHGETGLLVPPRDPQALAEAIARLLADPDRRRRMALAGRARAERAFGMARMVRETADLYRDMVQAGPASRSSRRR